jgi:hypothetical protein
VQFRVFLNLLHNQLQLGIIPIRYVKNVRHQITNLATQKHTCWKI